MVLGIDWLEWVGYLSSVLVAISLTMRSIARLRWYNLVGAAIFSAYGFMIGSLPVGLLNLFIVGANLYYLKGIYARKESISVMRTRIDDPYLQYYIEFYRDDIVKYFPGFDEHITDLKSTQSEWILLLLRDAQLAGILMGKRNGATLKILVDYVTVPYRDLKTGEYVYRHFDLFRNEGIELLVQETSQKPQQRFLKKMGFTEHPAERFELLLTKIQE